MSDAPSTTVTSSGTVVNEPTVTSTGTVVTEPLYTDDRPPTIGSPTDPLYPPRLDDRPFDPAVDPRSPDDVPYVDHQNLPMPDGTFHRASDLYRSAALQVHPDTGERLTLTELSDLHVSRLADSLDPLARPALVVPRPLSERVRSIPVTPRDDYDEPLPAHARRD